MSCTRTSAGNGSPQHRVRPCADRGGLHRRPPPGARAGRRRRLADRGAVQGARPARDEQAGPDAGHRRRRGGRGGIRRTLSRVRSRDAVIGEEQGSTGHSQRRWIIDPIDGTKNFVRGVPVWATLIALAVDDEVVLGVVSAPLLQRRWWASTGNGAWTGRSLLKATQCQVSDVRRLEDASLSYSSLSGWDERGRLDDFVVADAPVLADPRVRRLLVLHAARRGRRRHRRRARARACYDMAALDVIVREAGGRFTSLDGTDGPFGGNALATNGHLHDAALSFLGSLRRRRRRPRLAPVRARVGVRPAAAPAATTDPTTGPSPEPERPLFSGPSPLPSRFNVRRSREDRRSAQGQARAGVVTISPDAGVRELVAKLAEHNVGALIVSSDGADRSRASSASATSYATSTTTARSSTTPSPRS